MADEETKLTLKSLKKEFEDFKDWVATRLPEQNLKPVHGITEHIDPVTIPEEPPVNLVRFHLTHKEVPVREFSEEEHGKKWRDIANKFHASNVHMIRRRENL